MSTSSGGVPAEVWQRRALWAEDELRRLHMEITHAAIEQREKIQREEDETRERQRSEAQATALEAARVDAWYNHRLEEAVAGGDRTFGEFLLGDLNRHRADIPDGWPEGVTPEAALAAAIAEEDVAEERSIVNTALGQMLTRAGVLQPQVTLPRTVRASGLDLGEGRELRI